MQKTFWLISNDVASTWQDTHFIYINAFLLGDTPKTPENIIKSEVL